tara:strand:- start:4388 stop:4597 length:210 start_codon:yes stop_codon:yes gene_type:complete
MSDKAMLSVKALAEYLSVSEATVRTLLAEGKIPYLKIKGIYRFNLDEVLKALSTESQSEVLKALSNVRD